MINKFKQYFKKLGGDQSELQEQVLGFIILVVVAGFCFWAGAGEGRRIEREQLPENARLAAQFDRIERAFDANPQCQKIFVEEIRKDKK